MSQSENILTAIDAKLDRLNDLLYVAVQFLAKSEKATTALFALTKSSSLRAYEEYIQRIDDDEVRKSFQRFRDACVYFDTLELGHPPLAGDCAHAWALVHGIPFTDGLTIPGKEALAARAPLHRYRALYVLADELKRNGNKIDRFVLEFD